MPKPRTNGSQQIPKSKHGPHTFRTLEDAYKLIELMGETGLAELDLEMPQFKMSLRKNARMNILTDTVQALPTFVHTSAAGANYIAPPPTIQENTSSVGIGAIESSHHKIFSPMVGTFYRAPSPASDPYVKEGDLVAVGQPICIIEAMKLMNEIKSDRAGKILKVFINDANPVEKGSVLFEIDEGEE